MSTSISLPHKTNRKNLYNLNFKVSAFFSLTLPFLFGLLIIPGESLAENDSEYSQITVYKSPTCRCCSKWIKHLEKNGFEVKSVNREDMSSIKNQLGIKPELRSCHTGVVDGYYIEGHVPADDIKRLLSEKPKAAGLTVPGMPVGSPGMEGGRKDAYSVLLVDKDNTQKVYSNY